MSDEKSFQYAKSMFPLSRAKMDVSNIDSQALLNLILYGSPTLKETDNRILLEASIAYVKATNRLKDRAPWGSVG